MSGFGLVLDTRDPDVLAPFWAAALRYRVLGGKGGYTLLVPDGREGPQLLLQKVPEAKTAKNRMHLDIGVPDLAAEVSRLQALGARRLRSEIMSENGHSWILMADPEGNEFCVCEADAGH